MKKIITIDGLASSGKSTLSRLLAQKLHWNWLSSGVLYRGLAYVIDQQKLKTEVEYLNLVQSVDWEVKLTSEKSLFYYKNQDITPVIYQEKVDSLASHLSTCVSLRKSLLPIQRRFYNPAKGLVIEGRDSGTVVFPEAPLKIFLKASETTRAQRRAKDRKEHTDMVLKSQKERDQRDQNRDFAPVKEAHNSLSINSEAHSLSEILDCVYKEYQKIF